MHDHPRVGNSSGQGEVGELGVSKLALQMHESLGSTAERLAQQTLVNIIHTAANSIQTALRPAMGFSPGSECLVNSPVSNVHHRPASVTVGTGQSGCTADCPADAPMQQCPVVAHQNASSVIVHGDAQAACIQDSWARLPSKRHSHKLHAPKIMCKLEQNHSCCASIISSQKQHLSWHEFVRCFGAPEAVLQPSRHTCVVRVATLCLANFGDCIVNSNV